MHQTHRDTTYIDMDDRGSRHLNVVTTFIIVLSLVLVLVPFVVRDITEPADAPEVANPASQPAAPALCRLNVDVPTMLDPVARIVLPGWTLICDLLIQPDAPEALEPDR